MVNDKNKEVLILGNGISRLEYIDFIESWEGEIWGCNSIYLEIANGQIPRLDVMTGDFVALKEAVKYKKKYNLQYRIFGKNQKAITLPGVEILDIPKKFIHDSGTCLVARALLKGYSKIYICGFDLGGRDIYVQNHEKRNKSRWIRNWRHLAKEFGLERIEFIGKDHKPYIYSNEPDDYYAQQYLNGKDHLGLNDDKIKEAIIRQKVLIIGPDQIEESLESLIAEWRYELWTCNGEYELYENKVNAVGCKDWKCIDHAFSYREENELDYNIYYLEDKENSITNTNIIPFKEQRSWHIGSLMILEAIYKQFQEIFIVGFDFTDSFVTQLQSISQEFGLKNIKFLGKQPDFIL